MRSDNAADILTRYSCGAVAVDCGNYFQFVQSSQIGESRFVCSGYRISDTQFIYSGIQNVVT